MHTTSQQDQGRLSLAIAAGLDAAAHDLRHMLGREFGPSPLLDCQFTDLHGVKERLTRDLSGADCTAIIQDLDGHPGQRALVILPVKRGIDLLRRLIPDRQTLDQMSDLERNMVVELANVVITNILRGLARTTERPVGAALPILVRGSLGLLLDGENRPVLVQKMAFTPDNMPLTAYFLLIAGDGGTA